MNKTTRYIDWYVTTFSKGKCWDDARIKAKWDKYKNDRKIDREGEGSSLVLWIPQKRERIRDTTKGFVNDFREGNERHKVLCYVFSSLACFCCLLSCLS